MGAFEEKIEVLRGNGDPENVPSEDANISFYLNTSQFPYGVWLYDREDEVWIDLTGSGIGGGITIEGIYRDDGDAEANGVNPGEIYELALNNTLGLPQGMLKIRRV